MLLSLLYTCCLPAHVVRHERVLHESIDNRHDICASPPLTLRLLFEKESEQCGAFSNAPETLFCITQRNEFVLHSGL
eukprot:6186931-Pleurochrysis_carterae.AAC.4